MSDHAIVVSHVSKNFALPHEQKRSVKSSFVGLFRSNHDVEVQHALQNIDFAIKKGEFFGIVGRNGSGKSTLLKILAGIYRPTKGQVQTHGKLVPFIELGVGFNPELTGRDNVYLNGALLGFSKQEVDEQYNDIVQFAELERFMDQKLKNYSSGMQVRLAFSLAIRAKAEILLIDEVLAVGDADFQRKCFNYFRQLKKSVTTVVFVSHDMNAVVEYCDRAALIDRSQLVEVGDPEKIAEAYNRLFDSSTDGKQYIDEGSNLRWGDLAAEIVSCSTNKDTYHATDEAVSLEVTVRGIQPIEHNIAIGFLIKNSAGSSILGTNTYVQHHKIHGLTPGQTITVTWQIPQVFGDGDYVVDAALTSSDGSINHDWHQEMTHFKVIRDERTPYIITPSIPVQIEQK